MTTHPPRVGKFTLGALVALTAGIALTAIGSTTASAAAPEARISCVNGAERGSGRNRDICVDHKWRSVPENRTTSRPGPKPRRPKPPVTRPADPNRIPPGTIEDGVHYGYLTDTEGNYQITFDRADVEIDGYWTNNNPKLRTLPVDPAVWYLPADLTYVSAIEVNVYGQRVTGLFEAFPTDDYEECGC